MSRIVYLCSDLLFTSKIRETAQALGHTATAASDPESLASAATDAMAVIVDLRRPDALAALDALRAGAATRDVPTVGFCDHEHIERMDDARLHGCTSVLAKGKFSSSLQHLLAGAPADWAALT